MPWPRPTRQWRKRSGSSGPAGPCRHKQESSELLSGKHLNHLYRTGAQKGCRCDTFWSGEESPTQRQFPGESDVGEVASVSALLVPAGTSQAARQLSRSSLSAFAITSSDTPMSAAMAAQSDAWPASVSPTNSAFTARDRKMFTRMMASIRREC